MEQMHCNLLFRWFVGPGIDDPVWVPTVFTRNRDRLLTTEMSRRVMAAILAHREGAALLSDDHFPVDGTLVKAWASMKSFQPKDSQPPPQGDDPGGPCAVHDDHGGLQPCEAAGTPGGLMQRTIKTPPPPPMPMSMPMPQKTTFKSWRQDQRPSRPTSSAAC
jgi:hypothetical protein